MTNARRGLSLHTRSDEPIIVYVAADPASEDLNTVDQLKAYRSGDGPLNVDDSSTRFTIRALSYRERQDIEEQINLQFPDVVSESTARSAALKRSGAAEGTPLIDVENLKAEDVPLMARFNRLEETRHRLRVKAALVEIVVPGVDIAEPEGGWAALLDPDAETGLGDPETRVAILSELGAMIARVSKLGPKAAQHFRGLYGSPTPAPAVALDSPGDATDAPIGTESGAGGAGAPSSQG